MQLRSPIRSPLKPALRSPFTLGGIAFAVAALFAAGEPGAHFETYNPDSLLLRRNQLTFSEFPGGAIAQNGTYSGSLVTGSALAGYDGAIAVGWDGANPQLVGKSFSSGYVGATGVFSVVIKMDDGGAPVPATGAAPTSGAGDFSLVASNLNFNANVVALGNGFYQCWAVVTLPTAASVNVYKYATNSNRTFKTTAWHFQPYATTAPTYQKVTDWNTEYLAAAGSSVHLWQDNLRTVPVTAVEQTVGCWDDLSPNGKNATQATTGSRPKLSARYNMLTKTEQFSDAAWTKQNITAVAATDPNGGNSAALLTVTAGGGAALIQGNVPVVVGVAYKQRLYVKAGTLDTVNVSMYDGAHRTTDVKVLSGPGVATLNSSVGRVSGLSTIAWTLIEVTFIPGGTNGNFYFYTAAIAGGGNIGDTVYYAFPDSRTTNDWLLNNPTYQRVNTATDMDTAGFIHYLKFDGNDDSLQTAAIDCSGVGKMTAWAGLTKLSDAAGGILFELTADSTANSGTLAIFAPTSASPSYTGRSRGTATGDAIVNSAPYAAPQTSVLAVLGDIAGDSTILRQNGAQIASSVADQGAGNYSATGTVNIGRRNNTAAPYNGRLTSLTVRGTTTPASTAFIKSMEQYAAKLAGQTFVST